MNLSQLIYNIFSRILDKTNFGDKMLTDEWRKYNDTIQKRLLKSWWEKNKDSLIWNQNLKRYQKIRVTFYKSASKRDAKFYKICLECDNQLAKFSIIFEEDSININKYSFVGRIDTNLVKKNIEENKIISVSSYLNYFGRTKDTVSLLIFNKIIVDYIGMDTIFFLTDRSKLDIEQKEIFNVMTISNYITKNLRLGNIILNKCVLPMLIKGIKYDNYDIGKLLGGHPTTLSSLSEGFFNLFSGYYDNKEMQNKYTEIFEEAYPTKDERLEFCKEFLVEYWKQFKWDKTKKYFEN